MWIVDCGGHKWVPIKTSLTEKLTTVGAKWPYDQDLQINNFIHMGRQMTFFKLYTEKVLSWDDEQEENWNFQHQNAHSSCLGKRFIAIIETQFWRSIQFSKFCLFWWSFEGGENSFAAQYVFSSWASMIQMLKIVAVDALHGKDDQNEIATEGELLYHCTLAMKSIRSWDLNF